MDDLGNVCGEIGTMLNMEKKNDAWYRKMRRKVKHARNIIHVNYYHRKYQPFTKPMLRALDIVMKAIRFNKVDEKKLNEAKKHLQEALEIAGI